jgi:phage-related holin
MKIWEYVQSFIVKYIKPDIVKVIITLIDFLLPVKPMLIILSFLIIIDFITGVITSLKKKEKIVSSRIFNTVIKIYVYYSAILTMALIDVAFSTKILIYISVGFAIATEGKSIIENLAVFMPAILRLGDYLEKITKDEKGNGR